jgi:hypothetical protein
MAIPTVEQLIEEVRNVRANPGLPREASEGMDLDELRRTMSNVRAALASAVEAASDGAFGEQPASEDGAEIWAVGQILGHCNAAVFDIGARAFDLIGIDPGERSEDAQRCSEIELRERGEALRAVNAVDIDEYFGKIPADANLEAASHSDFFGAMPARAWLYFMAMHEADHVAQVRALG